jgi:hypothetical protein
MKFTTFCGTQRCTTMFTRTRHWSLSSARKSSVMFNWQTYIIFFEQLIVTRLFKNIHCTKFCGPKVMSFQMHLCTEYVNMFILLHHIKFYMPTNNWSFKDFHKTKGSSHYVISFFFPSFSKTLPYQKLHRFQRWDLYTMIQIFKIIALNCASIASIWKVCRIVMLLLWKI